MRKLPTLIACLLLLILAVPAQQTSRDRGIELYKQGNKAEAVSVLASALKLEDFKSDAEAWNYLGLAYFDLADYKQSRKALEKSRQVAAAKQRLQCEPRLCLHVDAADR